MCDLRGKCPTCGAPVKKCRHCGNVEFDPPTIYPQPYPAVPYGPSPTVVPYYPGYPATWISSTSGNTITNADTPFTYTKTT